MDTRHALAYGLIIALVLGLVVIVRFTRRAASRARRDANRPIRITKDQSARD